MISCKECKKLASANADLAHIIENLRDEISLKDNILIAIKDFVDNNKYKTKLSSYDILEQLGKILADDY